jgi:HTH-type transcriptional regulator/antitoxin HipB
MLLQIFWPNDMLLYMDHLSLQPLLAQIKAARERKGLSQRALGEQVGLPQSHISKIESGRVDLQASSLVELARALDLELTLVPRTYLPAIRAMQELHGPEIARGQHPPERQRPAYQLDEEEDNGG